MTNKKKQNEPLPCIKFIAQLQSYMKEGFYANNTPLTVVGDIPQYVTHQEAPLYSPELITVVGRTVLYMSKIKEIAVDKPKKGKKI